MCLFLILYLHSSQCGLDGLWTAGGLGFWMLLSRSRFLVVFTALHPANKTPLTLPTPSAPSWVLHRLHRFFHLLIGGHDRRILGFYFIGHGYGQMDPLDTLDRSCQPLFSPFLRDYLLETKRDRNQIITWQSLDLHEIGAHVKALWFVTNVLVPLWISIVTCSGHLGGVHSKLCLSLYILFVCLTSTSWWQPLSWLPAPQEKQKMVFRGKIQATTVCNLTAWKRNYGLKY